MTQLRRLLKPTLIRTCLEAVAGQTGLRLAVVAGGRMIAASGDGAPELAEGVPGVVASPLMLDGVPAGAVLGAGEVFAERAVTGLAQLLQSVTDAEHARRAVTAEALEAYREMALLHRAAVTMNHSLNPAQVARLLLAEFLGRGGARSGAVFLIEEDQPAPVLVACGPEGSEPRFASFAQTRIFAAILDGEVAGIVNEIARHPAAAADDAGFGCLLAVPLRAQDKLLGFLILLEDREFPAADLKVAETLASIAAISLHNAQLFADQKRLFSAMVDMIAHAIDAKSAYTSGHCRRVPVLARLLAETACAAQDGPLVDFALTDEEWEALDIAAALHDCGKIVTPEWVMDKATKLQTIHDRVTEIVARFTVLERDAELAEARGTMSAAELGACKTALADDLAFLRGCNGGGEFMGPEQVARVQAIAARRWQDANGVEQPLLTADEVDNLCISRGTLLPTERKVIEDHAALTREMLARLPFKGALRAVPGIAGGHHERLDGKGYPKGIGGSELSVQARILAIADVFEALTAPDRPYRRGATVSRAVAIMERMAEEGHLDPHLFRLMVDSGIHVTYARAHVRPEQVDV